MGARSKGCGTCKRRKVKCDETYPKCTRCLKAGIVCTGFAPRLRFVNEVPRIRRSIEVSHKQSHEYSTVAKHSRLAFHSGEIPRSQAPILAPFLKYPLSLTTFKDDIFISYLLSEFFERKDRYLSYDIGEIRCGLPTDWIPELAKTLQRPRYKSWDALAAIIFGQAHNSHEAIAIALRLYGQSLSELRNELSSPDNRCSDSTLASITALYLYEIFASKTEKGWMSHADGLGWLLEWRGPWQQKLYARKSIFLEHRIMLVARSIVARQSTFLRDPIWKTVPWEDEPTSKSAIDYLVDIGTDIAEYLAQINASNNSKSLSQELEYSQLRAQISMSLEELNTWWHQREAEHSLTATEMPSHMVICKPLFPTLLEYDMVSTAFMVCTYDAIRILLLQLWHMVQPFPNSVQSIGNNGVVLDMPNTTPLLGITSDTKGLACEILRSLTYCYRMSRRFISTFTFLFIQDVAYGCFDRDSKEALWVARHGWSELAGFDDVEHANLLKRLLPSGHIRATEFR